MYGSVKLKIGFAATAISVFYLLSDMLLDLVLEFLHLCFEALEFTLDIIIEHLFDTGRHATQTVTFYVILLFAAYFLFKLSRKLPVWYGAIKTELSGVRHQFTVAAEDYWHTAPVNSLVKWCSVLMIGVSMLAWGLLA
ncbi:hypothetical protein [Methylomicrobium lacus]|uniref:hypothetical protein n=1 Tax=Methylomicrobium lacus TaxID=136992 RepID=UPI0035A841DD